jgi:hypothetical protein
MPKEKSGEMEAVSRKGVFYILGIEPEILAFGLWHSFDI